MSKIKILITGANGYIGNCLFNFLKKNFNVSGLDRNNTFNKKIYKWDIMNIKKLEKICFLGCEEEKKLKQSIINSQNGKKNEY